MEKVLIEQLLNSGVSLKKIKSIIENTEKAKEQNLNETISANTCGLKLMVCSGCHKTMYEDKFMLNKMNKRYRSCINCVSRARIARQNKDKDKQKTILKNKDNGNLLAILDKEYHEETNNNSNNNNIYPFPYPIEKKEDIIVKPSNDKPNDDLAKYDIFEIIERNKAKTNIISNENYKSVEPETEPDFKLFNLFN